MTTTTTTTTSEAQPNIGDILRYGNGGTYIVLRIVHDYAVIGRYEPGITRLRACDSRLMSEVRTWTLVGRRAVELEDPFTFNYTIG